jgi:hypothetical protein
MKGGVMNTFCKGMLLSTCVIAVSSDLAEGRQRWVNYNHKAWADAHRETTHVGNPENFYRSGGNSGQVVVRREMRQSEPAAVAQTQTERRAFSYDEQQANAQVRTERAAENAQASDTQDVGTMQSPSEPQPMSVSNGNNNYSSGSNYSGGSNNTPRYALPKTDPRKYRTK